VAVVNGFSPGGQIYTSIDYGTNWTAQNSGIQLWEAVASSSDGSMLAATAGNGGIYTSTDYGTNWTLRYTLGSGNFFNDIASSTDGTKLVATSGGGTDLHFARFRRDLDSAKQQSHGLYWRRLVLGREQVGGNCA
jgi:photosystem II stability/assembly factor-like uncharacterized protein